MCKHSVIKRAMRILPVLALILIQILPAKAQSCGGECSEVPWSIRSVQGALPGVCLFDVTYRYRQCGVCPVGMDCKFELEILSISNQMGNCASVSQEQLMHKGLAFMMRYAFLYDFNLAPPVTGSYNLTVRTPRCWAYANGTLAPCPESACCETVYPVYYNEHFHDLFLAAYLPPPHQPQVCPLTGPTGFEEPCGVDLCPQQDFQEGIGLVGGGSLGNPCDETCYWTLLGNSGTGPANFLGTTDAKPLRIKTNFVEHMRISEIGLVGIGTETPQRKLEIYHHGNDQLRLSDANGFWDFWAGADFVVENNFDEEWIRINGSSNKLFLGPNKEFTIDTDLDLAGIFNTNPQASLDVRRDDGFLLGRFTNMGNGPDHSTTVEMINGSGLKWILGVGGQGNGGGLVDGQFYIERWGWGPVLTISETANVGINVSTPQVPLDVALTYGFEVARFTNVSSVGNKSALLTMENAESHKWIIGVGGDGHGDQLEDGEFMISGAGQGNHLVIKHNNGYVGIGTQSPQDKLHVNGKVRIGDLGGTGTHSDYDLAVDGKIVARKIICNNTDWADFVFEDDYVLMPLTELEAHIESKGHLPGIPTAEEVQQNGVDVSDIQVKLLQKVEELTLYVIQQNKRINRLSEENIQLQQQLNAYK